MKKIYAFTLSSDEYPSSSKSFADDLRVIAYMLYNEIFNYFGEGDSPLDINDKIEYNDLNENYIGFGYKFDSDLYDDGYTYYEPFIVGNDTFCFTISDEDFNEDIISDLFKYILNLLKLDYKVIINSVEYESRDIRDEKYRDDAIKNIHEKLGYKYIKKNKFVNMIKNSSSFKRRTRIKRKKCYGF